MNKFRTDIQGLRAFAVMAVVLFHFNPESLNGGFIGVDIFFVISGYLMTSIVLTGVNSGTFSLKKFYIARVVRIVPALLLLSSVVTILGFIFLNLVDATKLSTHAFSSVTFVSNIVYWLESGYFDAASKENWLLHTWSLSVEWQFYIIYPVVILLLSKIFTIKAIGRLTLLAILCGYGLSIWASNAAPSAAYFWLPTRAWELLLGGLAFLYPLNLKSQKTKTTLEVLGFSVLIGSVLLISEDVNWPGSMAIIPVLATLLIILSNNQNSVLSGNYVSQVIGKWSYSIYLWHWPLVVLIVYFELPKMTWLIAFAATFILGWMSFQFCENKFGKKTIAGQQWGPKYVVSSSAVVMFILAIVFWQQGSILKLNLDSSEAFIAGQKYFDGNSLIDATDGETYFLNQASKADFDYLAIGDSNLSHYVYGIEYENTKKVILSWAGLCLSLPNYMTKPTEKYMNKQWENYCKNNFKNISLYPNKPILLVHQWQKREMVCTTDKCDIDVSIDNYFNLLEQELHALVKFTGTIRPIFIVGQVPAPTKGVYRCMKSFDTAGCNRTSNEKNNKRVITNEMLERFSNNYNNVFFIDPFDAVCDDQYNCKIIIDDKSLFHDEGHLSAFGSKYFWKFISQRLSGM